MFTESRDGNFGVWVLYSLLFIGESIFDFDRILILNIKRHFWTFHERDILDPESELVRIISLRERAPQSWNGQVVVFLTLMSAGGLLACQPPPSNPYVTPFIILDST